MYPSRCSNGGQCSTRLNGNFNCDCLPGYGGETCEIGFFFFLNLFFLSFFQTRKKKKKNYLAVYCSYISNEGNAKWDETFANGQTVNGTCINGYYGIVSRNCMQDGSNGNWRAIIGSCDGILIFSSPFLLF